MLQAVLSAWRLAFVYLSDVTNVRVRAGRCDVWVPCSYWSLSSLLTRSLYPSFLYFFYSSFPSSPLIFSLLPFACRRVSRVKRKGRGGYKVLRSELFFLFLPSWNSINCSFCQSSPPSLPPPSFACLLLPHSPPAVHLLSTSRPLFSTPVD